MDDGWLHYLNQKNCNVKSYCKKTCINLTFVSKKSKCEEIDGTVVTVIPTLKPLRKIKTKNNPVSLLSTVSRQYSRYKRSKKAIFSDLPH